jgi:L-2-hydroxyglutarate oxidase LhgO
MPVRILPGLVAQRCGDTLRLGELPAWPVERRPDWVDGAAGGSDVAGQRIGVIGAGILGLAVARQLACSRPGAVITVLDKEDRVAAHQTGRNSGVVHAGLYYQPGSLKAQLCRRGMDLLRDYCAEHGITYDEVGKVVVATTDDELPGLTRIRERAEANGVPDLAVLDGAGLRDIEPHCVGVAAVYSPHTAIVDFVAVANSYADDVRSYGGQVLLGNQVREIHQRGDRVHVCTSLGCHTFDVLVACAGLGSDAVARAAGVPGGVRIVPFRGEYFGLTEPARALVRGLIYPVPDPRYPFLGVHLTRRFDGEVLVGPNAVMALAREGYRWRDVDVRDLASIARWPGSWRMGRQHWRTGAHELYGSLSKRAFLAQAQRYVPQLALGDLTSGGAGVRAQAVDRKGNLVDDFAIDVSDRVVLVRNAPSPGATSSLAIAEHIAELVP